MGLHMLKNMFFSIGHTRNDHTRNLHIFKTRFQKKKEINIVQFFLVHWWVMVILDLHQRFHFLWTGGGNDHFEGARRPNSMEVQSRGCLYQISLTHAQIGNKQLTTAQGWIATRLRVKSTKKTHAWGQPGETPSFPISTPYQTLHTSLSRDGSPPRLRRSRNSCFRNLFH